MSETIVKLIEVIAPILIAVITIIPSIKSSGKKTEEAIKEVSKKVDSVEGKLNEHIKESEFADAKQCRIRILRFYDELCEGKKHSENHFEDILEDIDKYKNFCNAHPDFPNSKGQIAMKHIEETYELLKKTNTFLTL